MENISCRPSTLYVVQYATYFSFKTSSMHFSYISSITTRKAYVSLLRLTLLTTKRVRLPSRSHRATAQPNTQLYSNSASDYMPTQASPSEATCQTDCQLVDFTCRPTDTSRAHRPVPKVKEKLDRILHSGVLKQINDADMISNMVVTHNLNNVIRMCVDWRTSTMRLSLTTIGCQKSTNSPNFSLALLFQQNRLKIEMPSSQTSQIFTTTGMNDHVCRFLRVTATTCRPLQCSIKLSNDCRKTRPRHSKSENHFGRDQGF